MPDDKTKSGTSIWVRLWPVYVIAAGLIAAWAFGLFDYLSIETLQRQNATLQAFVDQNIFMAVGAYILVYALATVFMLPGALWITIAGGLLFGLFGGSAATGVGPPRGPVRVFPCWVTARGNAAGAGRGAHRALTVSRNV